MPYETLPATAAGAEQGRSKGAPHQGFDPNQPFERLGNIHDSFIVQPTAEDNLALAARNYYEAKSQGLIWNEGDPNAKTGLEMLQTPLVKVLPEWTPRQLADMKKSLQGAVDLDRFLGTGTEHLEAAVSNLRKVGMSQTLAKSVNFFTSPLGLATLGLGAAPKEIQTAGTLLWTAGALKQSPELIQQLETELSKPEGQRDEEAVAELWTALGLNTGVAAAGAVGTVRGARGAKATEGTKGTETAAGEARPAAAAEQTRAAMERVLNTIPDFYVDRAGRVMRRPGGADFFVDQAGRTTAKLPKPPKAAVPETAPEPERALTAVQETRASGATTVGEVQEYWRRKTGVIVAPDRAKELLKAALRETGTPEEVNQFIERQTHDTQGERRIQSNEPQRQEHGPVPDPSGGAAAAETGGVLQTPPAEEAVAAAKPAATSIEGRAARLDELLRRVKAAESDENLIGIQREADAAAAKGELSQAGQNIITMAGMRRGREIAAAATAESTAGGEPATENQPELPRVAASGTRLPVAPKRAPSLAELTRPLDLIDALQGQYRTIDPRLIQEASPGWRPVGAARALFRSGGRPADTAADTMAGAGHYGGDPGNLAAFGDAINAAAEGRKGWRERVKLEREMLEREAKEAEMTPPSGKAHAVRTRPGASQGPSSEVLDPDWSVSGESEGESAATERPINERGGPAEEPGGRVSAMGSSAPRSRPMGEAARAKRAVEKRIRNTEEQPGGPASDAPTAGRDLRQAVGAAEPQRSALKEAFAWLNAPDATSPKRAMQLILRARLGEMYGAMRRADFALKRWRKEFDRTPVARGWAYQEGETLPRNYEVQRAIDTGDLAGLTGSEQEFAQTMRRLLDQAIEAVQEVSPNSLKDLYENYFPRLWKDPARNAGAIAGWLKRRPLEGSKSFLRQRVLGDWEDGLRSGLLPAYDNPADMVMAKLGEMYQFAATRRAFADLKAQGLRKFVYAGERPPTGWRAIDDPSSTAWTPPTVTIREAFDAQVRAKGIEFLEQLGIPHERTLKLRGKRWGEAHEGLGPQRQGELIRTKFGGPDFVIWHEAGHILDYRYPNLREMIPLKNAGKALKAVPNELRALADLRFEGQEPTKGFQRYVRSGPEKMANILDAYVRAPGKFREVAPTVWTQFLAWLDQHPDVKGPLNEIRPSLTLGTGETELWVGHRPLGKWYSPEPAVRVAEAYLSRGISSRKWYAGLRAMNGLFTSARLLGFFHGGMVTNDAQYASLGLALNDALRGQFARAGSELAKAPAMVGRAWWLGRKIQRAIDNPAAADAVTRDLAKYALEVNLRSHIGMYDRTMPRAWGRAMRELLQAPSTGAAWETLWRAPFALASKVMEPVMEGLVPRLKFGMHGLQTMRILADGAELEPMELRNLLAKSADSVEDRLGQVTYDNLFLHRGVKEAAQLGLTAFGWHFTKYRGVFGAGLDFARAAKALASGQKPEMTYRMTYLPAMVIGHAMIGGTIHYFLTGRRPDKLMDYLFPETGLVDAYGRPVRLAIADYVKDLARDVQAWRLEGPKGIVSEQVGRLAPGWNMLAEMYRNQDFWGTRIFSERQFGEPEAEHLVKLLGEGARYLAGSSQPFSTTAAQKLKESNMPAEAAWILPWVGVVPASRAVTMTRAEAKAAEVMQNLLPRGARTREQTQHAQAVAEVVRDVRMGRINNEGQFVQRVRAAGVKDKAELTRIKERVRWTPLQYQVAKMPLAPAMDVFDLGTEAEKTSLAPLLADKIQRAWDGGRLERDVAQRYVAVVKPWYQRAAQARREQQAPAGPARGRLATFRP